MQKRKKDLPYFCYKMELHLSHRSAAELLEWSSRVAGVELTYFRSKVALHFPHCVSYCHPVATTDVSRLVNQ